MLCLTRGIQVLKLCTKSQSLYNKSSKVQEKFLKKLQPVQFLNLKFCTSTANNEDDPNQPSVDIQEITGGDPTLEQKLQILILEMDVLREEGRNIPSTSFLKLQHWKELLSQSTKSARSKYLIYLFKNEMTKTNAIKKKEIKKQVWEENPLPPRDSTDVTNYHLGGNHIFLRFYDTTINHMYNNKLIKAMQFGQKLVIDCGYQENMTKRENTNCAKQLTFLFAENRNHKDPFDVHLCNSDKDGLLMNELQKFIKTLYEPSFPLHVHSESYLEQFPKEKLVYLTPHCRDVLDVYDHDAIYIIGAIVDKINNEPLSLAKAKKEGIQMKKLPLDKYMDWGAGGGKSLTINQVIAILLDLKDTGDWKYALRHVPRRKLADFTLNAATQRFNKRVGIIGGGQTQTTNTWGEVKPPMSTSTWKPANSNKYTAKPVFNSRKVNSIFDDE